MNEFLQAVEEGYKYGLKLHNNKCELITTHATADDKQVAIMTEPKSMPACESNAG